jgi:hypothetical protein
MGRKEKVKVLLEPRQTESNIEDKGDLARGRLVELLDAARKRPKAKHRKAHVSWVSQLPVVKPDMDFFVDGVPHVAPGFSLRSSRSRNRLGKR